jgi:diphosphomevalonate decarboxylase
MKNVRVRALANLALVKYFGKRDLQMNLPAAGSLSLTLEPLSTTTEIAFRPELERDMVLLDGKKAADKFASRVSGFLDIVRDMSGTSEYASVVTENAFPTAAGLASSASGFAALAYAATKALGMTIDKEQLSALARRGSGSAARSIPGGIVVWNAGEKSDGSDSFAYPVAGPDDWDLRVVIGVADPGPKAVGSTEAMELTRTTSPYYREWLDSVHIDLMNALRAVEQRNFTDLGEITERSALSMHAAALAGRPGILFWNGTTVEAIHLVRRLRQQGTEAYFTCDAGPQPKIVCTKSDEDTVASALESLPGITRIIRCHLGAGVTEI